MCLCWTTTTPSHPHIRRECRNRVTDTDRMQASTATATGGDRNDPDYVVFARQPQQAFSRAGLEKATATKLKLEHYYKKAVDDVVDRNKRYVHAMRCDIEWGWRAI